MLEETSIVENFRLDADFPRSPLPRCGEQPSGAWFGNTRFATRALGRKSEKHSISSALIHEHECRVSHDGKFLKPKSFQRNVFETEVTRMESFWNRNSSRMWNNGVGTIDSFCSKFGRSRQGFTMMASSAVLNEHRNPR